MHEGRGGNERITIGSRIGDVEPRATSGDRRIDGKDSLFESANLLFEPIAKHFCLSGVPPFDAQYPLLYLEDRNDRQVE